MERPDRQTLQAFVRLGATEDGKTLLKFIGDNLDAERKVGDIILDETQLRMNQGRRQVLNELLGTVLNAQTMLEMEEKARESAPKTF